MTEASFKRRNKISELRANLKQILPTNNNTARITLKLERSQSYLRPAELDRSKGNLSSGSSQGSTVEVTDDPLSSNSFSDRYVLEEKIGEGCNGCVYRCVCIKNGRTYAVKKQHIEEEELLQLKKSFIHMREFYHESIVSYRALYFDDSMKTAFLVMDYLENYHNLAELPYSTSEEDLRVITKGILGALQYLHNRNVCHRDIKPDNIMVHKDTKKIKLIDFGISKKTYQRGNRREMLTVIGTPFYLAP